MREPASYDLGSRIRAPDTVPGSIGTRTSAGPKGDSGPPMVDTPASVTPLAALLVHSLSVQSARRHFGAEAGTSTSHFLLPNGCASLKLTTAAFVVEPAVQTGP